MGAFPVGCTWLERPVYGISYYGIPNFVQALCLTGYQPKAGFFVRQAARQRPAWGSVNWRSIGERDALDHFKVITGQTCIFQRWAEMTQLADTQVLQYLCPGTHFRIDA